MRPTRSNKQRVERERFASGVTNRVAAPTLGRTWLASLGRTYRLLAVLAVLALSTVLNGCLAAPAEEAEHHVPAHRPIDFPAAVARLEALHAELLDGKSDRPVDSLDALTELSDVVRWLPELAADSDLDRKSWDRVAATTRLFEEDLSSVRAATGPQRSAEYANRATLLEKHLRALRDLSEIYRAQENRP